MAQELIYCKKCNKKRLTNEEWANLNKWIEADQKFDGGEWSGSFDYHQDICLADCDENCSESKPVYYDPEKSLEDALDILEEQHKARADVNC